MNIVQINAVYEISSTGRTVMELDQALKNRGHASYVFCTNRSDEANGIYCMGTPFSRKAHAFLSRMTGLQGYFSSYETRKMLRLFDKIKPDVVNLGNLHGNYINVNMTLDYLAAHHIPTVITLHDCWLFTGHCCHYLEENCEKWQTGCHHCPAIHKWNASWFFDTSKKVWKDRKERFEKIEKLVIVGVSDWITNESKKSIFQKNAVFKRIYNWIDLDVFSPGTAEEYHERPIVLSVSQGWSNLKGLADIIEVAKDNPEYDFMMVGKLDDGVKLPSNVKAIGTINQIDELVRMYRKANVLLHLSYQETFGKVVAEALACGTPAIVYNVTALPELIGPGCGAVIEKGNWKKASETIREIIAQGKAGVDRDFVEKSFGKQNVVQEKIDAIINAVVYSVEDLR